jgi:hypothetical protein
MENEMTTPRDALIRNPEYGFSDDEIDCILTAISPFLRTPGTVEVCAVCDMRLSSNQYCEEKRDNCPLKPKETTPPRFAPGAMGLTENYE